MKKLFFTLAIVLLGTLCQAQEQKNKTKSIQVAGSAEMEITPDEIYFTIVLEEYMEEKEKKVPIEKLEQQLKESVAAAGIAKENLTIENIYGQNWQRKKRQKDFLEKKSYILKLSEPSKMDAILDKIDQKAIENVFISKYWHSKMEEYRKQLKIQAIKNAKEKAKYLLEAINENLGPATLIQESSYDAPVVFDMNPQYKYNMAANTKSFQFSSDSESIEVKKISLRMEIHAEFEIK